MRAWTPIGCSAAFLEELEPGLYLSEWLDGRPLSVAPPDELVDFRALGGVLRAAHGTPPPVGLEGWQVPPIDRDRPRWRFLSAEQQRVGNELAAALTGCQSPVLLHADLAPSNVMLTDDGPRVIDPVGRVGPAAWDFGQLAATSEGRGRALPLDELFEGYGGEPDGFAEAFGWQVLNYLQKNAHDPTGLAATRLRPLADLLVRAGEPAKFLSAYKGEPQAPGFSNPRIIRNGK